MKKDNKALIIETLNPKLKAKLLLLLIMNKWEEWEVNKPYLRVRRGKRKRRRDSLFVCLVIMCGEMRREMRRDWCV
jgi:hypothetical protein